MTLGFVYPAYECYKVVEKKSPHLEHLQFWCQYWMIIALMTVLERLGDVLISWVPMYSEAKLAFVIYLWYPKTMGTTYVYNSLLRPFVAKHELEIDQNLNELKTRASDVALLWCQRGSMYVQTRFFELLQFLALQSDRSQKVSVPIEGTPIAPPRPSTQGHPQSRPQINSFYPPQLPPKTTSVGSHLNPYCLQGDQVGQRINLPHESRSHTLSNGEEEPCYYEDHVERSRVEQTLPPQALNTKILVDNPWFVLARIKLLLFLCFSHEAN
jgi:receptor expression-enhancing protein 1/2/3/4